MRANFVILIVLLEYTILINCLKKTAAAIPITEDLKFEYYSRSNPNTAIELKIDESLNDTINKSLPWKFFIHGWTTNPEVSPWFHTGKAAYLKRGHYNIVFVDWSKAGNKTYPESVANAIGAGHYFGKFILHLTAQSVSLENIHLVSHSLGSHMAGFAGKYVAANSETIIRRITALDPAGPLYEWSVVSFCMPRAFNVWLKYLVSENKRLSRNDADFVDVIHTDMGKYGIISSFGHIDFFPNGGYRMQPGCENTDDENCSHARSTRFYVESILSKNFLSRQCPTIEDYKNGFCWNNTRAIFGEDVDQALRGDFYFLTNSEPPYAQNENGH